MRVDSFPRFAARDRMDPLGRITALVRQLERTSGHSTPLYGVNKIGYDPVLRVVKSDGEGRPVIQVIEGFQLMAEPNGDLFTPKLLQKPGQKPFRFLLCEIPYSYNSFPPEQVAHTARDIRRRWEEMLTDQGIPIPAATSPAAPVKRQRGWRRLSLPLTSLFRKRRPLAAPQ